MVPVPRPLIVGATVADAVLDVLDVVVDAVVLGVASDTDGFAATVGDGINVEFVVGVAIATLFVNSGAAAVVVIGVAAIVALFVTVGFAATVVGGISVDCVVGVATAVAVVKTGAAAFVTVAATRGVTALLTKGPFTPKPATPVVAATVAGAIADAVAGATTAFAVTGATVTAPVVKIAPPPPPSFVMTGVGGELIDAFTVICGFAIKAGGTNCPVGGV